MSPRLYYRLAPIKLKHLKYQPIRQHNNSLAVDAIDDRRLVMNQADIEDMIRSRNYYQLESTLFGWLLTER